MNLLKTKDQPKVVVLGLDGVPYSLLKDFIQKGLLPHMGSLFRKGYFGQMEVSIPEVSSVSWSSFMTGTQPGEHGIFGFMDLKPNTYKMCFPNFRDLKAVTIWDEFGPLGKRAVVLNLPSTYPAREIPGVLISGFVALDLNKAIYPPSLIPKLEEIGYKIDIDTMRARRDHDFLIKELHRSLESRERAADYLWFKESWDLFMVVITGTDRLNHYLWEAFGKPSHRYQLNFLDYYRRVDRFVGDLYRRYLDIPEAKKKDHHFIMLSDHGFTGIRSEVYLNRWLQENRYLNYSSERPRSIEEIGPGTLAFALDPSRIYIHLEGKYPRGEVRISEYEPLRDELKEKLQGLSFDGRPVLKRVLYKEDVYSGPFSQNGPDLVLVAHNGFDLKGSTMKEEVFGKTDLSGMHTQDDAFFYSDQGEVCKSIFGVKEVILNSYR